MARVAPGAEKAKGRMPTACAARLNNGAGKESLLSRGAVGNRPALLERVTEAT